MRSSRFLRPTWGLLALGLALSLLAVPMAARADDEDDNDKDQGTVRIYRHKDGATADQRGGYLGVQVQNVTRSLRRARDLPTSEGALVNRVENDSPADVGGLRRGDVIVELDGKKVENSEDLIEAVRDLEPGTKAKVTLWRSGSLKTVTVKVGERPADWPMTAPGFGRMRAGDPGDEESMPLPPSPREMRSGRVGERLQALQEQLRQLREVEIPKLEEEIRSLRQEMRGSQDDEEDDD